MAGGREIDEGTVMVVSDLDGTERDRRRGGNLRGLGFEGRERRRNGTLTHAGEVRMADACDIRALDDHMVSTVKGWGNPLDGLAELCRC